MVKAMFLNLKTEIDNPFHSTIGRINVLDSSGKHYLFFCVDEEWIHGYKTTQRMLIETEHDRIVSLINISFEGRPNEKSANFLIAKRALSFKTNLMFKLAVFASSTL